jgi:hypothetical protein
MVVQDEGVKAKSGTRVLLETVEDERLPTAASSVAAEMNSDCEFPATQRYPHTASPRTCSTDPGDSPWLPRSLLVSTQPRVLYGDELSLPLGPLPFDLPLLTHSVMQLGVGARWTSRRSGAAYMVAR